MNTELRAKRAQRRARRGGNSKLNLVSLMDIFTILVFFLLFNSSDVEILQTDKSIKLPDSVATEKPDVTVVVRVSADHLFVGDRAIAEISKLPQDADEIEPLSAELKYLASRAGEPSATVQEKGRSITIMGDKELPYALLKQIMNTCANADYRDIAFAVSQTKAQVIEGESPVTELEAG